MLRDHEDGVSFVALMMCGFLFGGVDDDDDDDDDDFLSGGAGLLLVVEKMKKKCHTRETTSLTSHLARCALKPTDYLLSMLKESCCSQHSPSCLSVKSLPY